MRREMGENRRSWDASRQPCREVAKFKERWSPKIAGEINDFYVKLVKIEGEFVWHSHEHEDELFLVLVGELRMRFRNREELVGPGEFIIVPHGVERGDAYSAARTENYAQYRECTQRPHRGEKLKRV